MHGHQGRDGCRQPLWVRPNSNNNDNNNNNNNIITRRVSKDTHVNNLPATRRRSRLSSSSPSMLQPLHLERRWNRRLAERRGRWSTATGTLQRTPPPQRRGTADAHAGAVRVPRSGPRRTTAPSRGQRTRRQRIMPAASAGLWQRTTPRKRRRTEQREPSGSLAPLPHRQTEEVKVVALEAKQLLVRTVWTTQQTTL